MKLDGDRAEISVAALDVPARGKLLADIEGLRGKARSLELDLASVKEPGTLAAATVLEVIELAKSAGIDVALTRPSKELDELLRLYRIDRLLKASKPPVEIPGFLEAIGGHVLDAWAYTKDLAYMGQVALYWGVLGPLRGAGLK
ncbi:MAG TPA: hypothetical protein VFF73_35250, partial [Planctomycetota bacterium]|nr:hypothetical protein [Planctomycetota bacterium]